MVMNQTKEARNKALVLEAFDTLFNQRDYAAAEKYWSPDYIQHSAHIAQGRDGLFGDAALVERDQSLVGDRDPVSVARQISQHRFRSRKRALGVHHPLTGSHRRKPLGEGCRIVERRVFAEEPQLTPAMGRFQCFEKAPAKRPSTGPGSGGRIDPTLDQENVRYRPLPARNTPRWRPKQGANSQAG
jgi:hypothetical protein